jgi:glucan phosphoethanolaminetransferase (alkaline phosphatase superfamily)
MTSTELYDDPGEKAIAIIPKFTSSLSLIGSLWIIVDIARQRTKWKRTYERLVLGMSLGDVVYSFGTFLSTWPIPVGSPFVWAAMGNTQTCEAQGFIIQFGGIFELYNAFLAVYYLLTLKYRLKRHQILNFEKAAHIFVLSVSTITSFAGLFLNLYNNADGKCGLSDFFESRPYILCAPTYTYYIYFLYLFLKPTALSSGLLDCPVPTRVQRG